MYYAILYFMVEVMKGDEDFGDELSNAALVFVNGILT